MVRTEGSKENRSRLAIVETPAAKYRIFALPKIVLDGSRSIRCTSKSILGCAMAEDFDRNKFIFDEERAELRRWPYSVHSVEETLDSALIEGRGRQLLFQALNQRNAVAFVGSGISQAFGRLSWSEWLTRQLDLVKGLGQSFVDCVDASDKMLGSVSTFLKKGFPAGRDGDRTLRSSLTVETSLGRVRIGLSHGDAELLDRFLKVKRSELTYRRAEVHALLETLTSLEDKGAPALGDPYPIQFQVADQLQKVLLGNRSLFLRPTEHSDSPDPLTAAWLGFFLDSPVSPAPPKLTDAVAGLKQLFKAVQSGATINRISKAGRAAALDVLVPQWLEYAHAFGAYQHHDAMPEARFELEEVAKILLVDEIAHVESILWRSVEYGTIAGRDPWSVASAGWRTERAEKPNVKMEHKKRVNDVLRRRGRATSTEDLRRDVEGIRQNPGRYSALAYMKTTAFSRLIAALEKTEPTWPGMFEIVRRALDENGNETSSPRRGAERTFVSPTHRFVFEMLMALPADPLTLPLHEDADDPNAVPSKVEASDFSSRTSIIDPDADPLETIVMRLGISRFLTTNYDFEIERFYQDRGYRQFVNDDAANGPRRTTGVRVREPEDHRIDPLGGTFKDHSFSRDRAVDLVNFAIDFEGADGHVIHLHGSAAHDASTVITERDYMELYLRQDRHRDTVNEAIKLGFSANPLVFLGLGMTEADVLRPLRQFMSDRDRTVSRTAIVVSPATHSPAAQRKFSAMLYLRYGAHTIFYGRATVPGRDASVPHTPTDWLYLIDQLLNALRRVNEAFRDAIVAVLKTTTPDGAGSPEILARLDRGYVVDGQEVDQRDGRAAYIDSLVGRPDATGGSALAVLLGFGKSVPIRAALKQANWWNLKAPDFPAADDGGNIAGSSFVGVECSMLGEILRATIDDQVSGVLQLQADIRATPLPLERIKALRSDVRRLNARLIGIKGLHEAILTGTLCGSLRALEADWQHWWRHWQLRPPERQAKFELVTTSRSDLSAHVPPRYVRHRIDNVIDVPEGLDDVVPDREVLDDKVDGKKKRPTQVTGIRSFDTFVEALKTYAGSEKAHEADCGRRWFCVAASRGVGRGTFLSAFETENGLAAYISALWPTTHGGETTYASAIFINLSFSTEIASSYDMLVDALVDINVVLAIVQTEFHEKTDPVGARERIVALQSTFSIGSGGDIVTLRTNRDALNEELEGLARLGKLKNLLRRLRSPMDGNGVRTGAHLRVLLCLNGIDLLHHAGSLPKNREIEDFLDFLASDDVSELPLDLVTITGELNPGEIILGDASPFLEKYQAVTGPGEGHEKHTKKGMPTYASLVSTDLSLRATQHLERRQERLGITFPKQSELALIPPSKRCFVHLARVVSPEQLLVDYFKPLAALLFLYNSAVKAGDRKTLAEEIVDFRLGNEGMTVDGAWSGENAKKCHENNLELREERLIRVTTRLQAVWPDATLHEISKNLIGRYAGDIDAHKEWHEIRTVLGSNRYCLTVMLAAAQRIALSGNTIEEAGRFAEQFIRKVVDHVRAVSSTGREEAVLHDVLDAYEAFHQSGRPNDDNDLQLLILRHLAVIGGPVGADVLVRAPAILAYFDGMKEHQHRSRHLRLVQALTSMAERGLVFRLHPNPKLVRRHNLIKDEKARKEELGLFDPKYSFRYALHRLAQKHIIRKMGSGPREFVEINNYAPSLYASMPADLPRLSHDAHGFLKKLVDSLSQYPDRPGSDAVGASWHFGAAPLSTRMQALRAALSIVRSTYSVGVVSRFEDYLSQDTESSVPARGHFETYRVQVRWLIRKAWELWKKKGDGNPPNPADEGEHIQAFYRDEIVWLYNECGVVCLVQGNLHDAGALLRQALRFNREIEGNIDGGPQHNRISLNLAIAQIERGRLLPALKRLEEICEAEARHRKGRVWYIANGYIGLIYHLRGDRIEAARRYEAAIRVLRTYNDLRSCSIFSRHYADLERYGARLDGTAERLAQAEKLIADAISFAQSGGHEDLHKRARLSRVQLEISKGDAGRGSTDAILGQLRLIEEYAEKMEMPSLVCDVLVVRARLFLRQGEASPAGSLLGRAMAIAQRSGMGLRLNAATTAYARVLAKRDMKAQANELLFTCLEIAKRSGNQAQIAQVEQAFDEMHRDT